MGGPSAQSGSNKKGLYRFLAVIVTAAGLFLIIPSQNEINQARAVSKWIPRMAKITHSSIRQYGGGRAHDTVRYVPEIKGVFLDSREPFDVYRVSFAEIGSKSLAVSYTRRFAKGVTVPVYVSPTDPGKVVLIKDVPLTRMYIMEAIGGLLIFAAFYLFIRSKQL